MKNKEESTLQVNLNNLSISELKINKKKQNIDHAPLKTEKNHSEDDECIICLSTTNGISSLDCLHKICVICHARLFFLVKDVRCPVCLLVTPKPSTDLLVPKCQKCSFVAKSIPALISHYKSHNVVLCKECLEHKFQFPYEYVLYDVKRLSLHKRCGLKEETGFYGHVSCIFCKKYFYNADVCKKHCREVHFLCTVCESLGHRDNYYRDSVDLHAHLKDEHHGCDFSECKGVSFAFESGLVEHMFRVHKIGDGRINLYAGNKKMEIEVMNPYAVEKKNSCNNLKDKDKSKNESQKENQDFKYGRLHGKNNELRRKNVVQSQTNNTILYGKNAASIQRNNIVSAQTENTVPFFLNRSQLKIENNPLELFEKFLKKTYSNHQDIFETTTQYYNREINPENFLERIEFILTGKETIKFAEKLLGFLNGEAKARLAAYLKEFKNRVMFPKFERNVGTQEVPRKKEERKFGFKILEIRKK